MYISIPTFIYCLKNVLNPRWKGICFEETYSSESNLKENRAEATTCYDFFSDFLYYPLKAVILHLSL